MKKLLYFLFLIPFITKGQVTGTGTIPAQSITVTVPSTAIRGQISSVNPLLRYDASTGVFTLNITSSDTARWNKNASSTPQGVVVSQKDTAFWNKLTSILNSGTGISLIKTADSNNIVFYTFSPSATIDPVLSGNSIIFNIIPEKPVVFYNAVFTPGNELKSVYNGTTAIAITLPAVGSDRDGIITIVNMSTSAITINGVSFAGRKEIIYAVDAGVWKRVSTTTIQ